ncbi:MAG: helix-turn-helix transcriptional regulator [Paludibacteraceae bacterium]|nr:helix-turn-helix transcriptional regulator [Paludibacteraceae bacterium]
MEHNYTENSKVADIILANREQMLLLEHLGIELVVKGKSVRDICLEHNICTDLFLSFVRLYDGETQTAAIVYHNNDIDTILLYLGNCHKYYLDEKIPKIMEYVNCILEKNPNLKMLQDFTEGYIKEITEHFDYENNIVFPYVRALALGKDIDNKYSVEVYKRHHSNIEDKLDDLQELLIKYLPFDDSVHLRRKMLQCLSELEYDLKIHSHIEDNILIPLVEKLEKDANAESDVREKRDGAKSEDVVLSAREIDVLRCLVQGLQSKEIAEKLFISTNTVITHRKNISEKTGIKSLAGLTIYAIVHSIINIDDVSA